MLVHLAIRNLAVIADAAVDFGSGLNVLTGETGAGKSIVVGALELVLGGRARSDGIRAGAPRAEVQAVFRIPRSSDVAARLSERDLLEPEAEDHDGDTVDLLVRRLISPSGRGRVYINGILATVGTLANVTKGLVDISSQHEHTALLDVSGHLDLLDRSGGHTDRVAAFSAAWAGLTAARAHLDGLQQRDALRIEREDYLRFQLDEIDSVGPQPDEEEALSLERQRLTHAEQLVAGVAEVESTLSGRSGSVTEVLGAARRMLERLGELDPALAAQAERLEAARIEAEDVAYEARRYGDQVDMDPRRLTAVDERLDALRKLRRKHGPDLAAVLERASTFREELEGFESLEIEITEADTAVEQARAVAEAAAHELSEARRGAAVELARRIDGELESLAMTGACVRFELRAQPQLGPHGFESGELLIRTNKGEEPKALARVASGGELSRLLLALKRALAEVDPALSCVFDEVDAGVGGAVAEVIGLKLREIAAERQVIAITHLPQIAAHADHHLIVVKDHRGERTSTEVRALESTERVDELARMLGGLQITSRTRDHAAELLELTRATRH